jgi:general secretion pathway protein C
MTMAWFWVVACGAAISLGVTAAPVIWHVLGEVETGVPVRTAPADDAPPPPADVSPILVFAPFGSAVPVAAPVVVAEVQQTQLGLTLLGIALATPAAASRAIIAGGDLPVSSYAIGSQITAAVTLAEVYPDHVVLMVNGTPETLFFVENPNAQTLQPVFQEVAPDAAQLEQNNPDVVIARYRAEILQNPQSVMDRLGLQATPNGYLIREAADPGVRQAGFQPGDLVTRVNGQTVGDVAQDQIYFDEIAASGRATVEVQRGADIIVMTFPLR